MVLRFEIVVGSEWRAAIFLERRDKRLVDVERFRARFSREAFWAACSSASFLAFSWAAVFCASAFSFLVTAAVPIIEILRFFGEFGALDA
jgi:hypothetical protein